MILDLISIIVSGFAIVISSYFAQMANRMNKKVNEKDYEISEQLKYDLLRLIATLRFYDSKAALSHLTKETLYDRECSSLADLMLSPSYLLLLQSINPEKRDDVELKFYILANNQDNALSVRDIRFFCHYILDIFKSDVDFKGVLDIDVINTLKSFCNIESFADAQYEKMQENKGNNESDEFERFIVFLTDNGVQDADVKLFDGVIKNDKDIVASALDEGAKTNVADKDIIKRYSSLYEQFKRMNK
jgi:hypothetical protein